MRPAVAELAVRPARHAYAVGVIDLFLNMVLSAAASLRSASAVLQLTADYLPFAEQAPAPNSGRGWLLRLGLFRLTAEPQRAEDWVWLMDHTLQLGPYKCLLIVGIRLSNWDPTRPLRHEDLTLLNLTPMESSSGEQVREQLAATAEKAGVPRAVVSDEGTDLKRAMQLLRQDHPAVRHQLDLKHKNARLLKAALDDDPQWSEFVGQANRTKLATTQTSLAFLNPPALKTKARYMNLDTLVEWGIRTLAYLDRPAATELPPEEQRKLTAKLGWLPTYQPALARWSELLAVAHTAESLVQHGVHMGIGDDLQAALPPLTTPAANRLARDLAEFLAIQSADLLVGERMIGSTEVLESIIGRYKRLQSTHSKGGMTAMLLSIGAFVGRRTLAGIQAALETVRSADIEKWCQEHLGLTIQSQKRLARSATKTG